MQQCGKIGVCGEGVDGFDGEIGVVCDVSGEIVGGQLIFWIESMLLEVEGPLGELRPEALCQVGVAFGASERIYENDEVAGFFDGHLIFFGLLSAAVVLAVCQGVLAEVVRREGEVPTAGHGRIFEHGKHLRFKETGIEEEKDWRGWVHHIYRRDVSVGEVLLSEKHGVAVSICDQFVRCDGLAIGENAEPGVLLSGALGQVVLQFVVHLLSALFELGEVVFGGVQHGGYRHVIALPVGSQVCLQELDGEVFCV